MASLLDQFKAKWIDSVSEAMTPEQYAAKKKMMAAQPHLFDSHAGQENLGVGRWITIGAEKDEDGQHHGGHHVFVGGDGRMKTGAFAGKTMDEAFGGHAKAEATAPQAPKPFEPTLASQPKEQVDGDGFTTEPNEVSSEEIKSEVPGLAVDPKSIRGTDVLFNDEIFTPREINARRIAARKRRQQIERDMAGLFADQVAAEQKDPEEELQEHNEKLKQRVTAADTGARDKWINNLKRLAEKSPDEQSKLVSAWNATASPKDHAYFAGWLTKAEKQGLAQQVTDRSDIADPELRSQVERMDKTWRTLKDIERAANPESSVNISGARLKEELDKYNKLGIKPPEYRSDKPSWDELQAKKQAELEAKQAEKEQQRKELEKSLLFPIDELKSVVGKSSENALPPNAIPSSDPSRPPTFGQVLSKPAEQKPQPGIQQPPTAPGDQLGLFGDTFKAPAKKPVFEPTLATGGKQQGLFDTSGNANQMQLFGDAATPEDLVYKPEAKEPEQPKPFEPVLSKDPIPLRERKSVALELARGGMLQTDIADHLMSRGVASVDARRLASDATFEHGVQQSEAAKQKKSDEVAGRSIDQMRKDGLSEDEIQDVESNENYFNVAGDPSKASDQDLNRAHGHANRLISHHERNGRKDMAESIRREQEAMKAEIKRRNDVEGEQKPDSVEDENLTPAQKRALKNTATLEPKHRLQKPIKGKTGSSIIGYQWVSKIEEDERGRDKRVSDWGDSQTSETTGRNIVHLFWVEHPDGSQQLLGSGAAQKALGMNAGNLRSVANRERERQQYAKQMMDQQVAGIEKVAASSAEEADAQWKQANNASRSVHGDQSVYDKAFAESKVFTKDGKFIRTRSEDLQAGLAERGWSEHGTDEPKAKGWTKTKTEDGRDAWVDSHGIMRVKAKAGGEVSDVTGKMHAGGSWMPIHGMSKKSDKPAKQFGGEETSGKPKESKEPPKPREISKEEAARMREERERQDKWDTVKSGHLNDVFSMGERPHSLRQTSGGTRTWQKVVEDAKLSPEHVKKLADEYEGKMREWARNNANRGRGPDGIGLETPEDAEKAYIENAELIQKSGQPYWTKKILKSHPDLPRLSHYVSDHLEENGDHVNSLHDLHNKIEAMKAAKPEATKPKVFEPTLADKPLSDVLLSDDETKNPPSEEAFTFGDAVKTPDGKVGIMSGKGGMASDRVTLNHPDGTTSYEDRAVLSKAKDSEHPEGFEKHRDQWGQHTWKPKNVSDSEWGNKSLDDRRQHLRNMPKGRDVLLSSDDPIEPSKADFNLKDGAGKAHTSNELLNKPKDLTKNHVSNAYKAIDKKQHEALHAHIASVRPDLAEHSQTTMEEHSRMKDAKEESQKPTLGAPPMPKPWDQMTRREKQDYTDSRWTNFFKNTLKPGDQVSIGGNSPITVKRVNKNGISSEGGGTWSWSQIGYHGDPKEGVKKLQEFETSPEQWSERAKAAIKKDVAEGVSTAEGLKKLLKPEGLEAIKNASPDTLGHHVESLAKQAPGASRADIRKAIDEYRKSEGVEDKKDEDSGKIRMTINSETPHADEIRHALEHIEQNGRFYHLRDPETGEVKRGMGTLNSYESKNEAINAFINKQRRKATGGEHFGNLSGSRGTYTRVRGNYRSWLKSHGLKESDLTGIDEAKQKREAEIKALASKTFGLDDYKAHMQKLDKGEVTPEEHKAAFAQFQANREAIKAELSKMKKDDIESWHHEDGMMRMSSRGSSTKAAAIDERLRDFASSFDKSEDANRWSYGEDLEEKLRKGVESTSAEHLKSHADDYKARQEERTAKRKAQQEAMDNPKTAYDWQQKRIAAGGYLNMTPAQQAAHDDAMAAHRRERQPFKPPKDVEVRQLSKEGKNLDFALSKNFHSKRGHDIFTASPGDRVDKDSNKEMESAAKRLGGWYYKAYGGTPGGFHFKTEEAREKFLALQKGFVDLKPEAEADQADRQEQQASRLQDLAESQRERAEAKLNVNRKDNTARRARMAASAESDARKELAQAQTLEKIANHIADGKAVHLANVKNRAQVSQLDAALRNAKWNAIRHAEKHDPNYKALSYNEREARSDGPTREEDIAHAEYPFPYLHKSEALSHASKLANIPGLKKFAGSLKKMAESIGTDGKDYGQITDRNDIEKLKEALPKMRRHPSHEVRQIASRFAEKLDSMKRLESMDIATTHELRAALREYHGLRQQEAGADPIKEAERKLKRSKIEGFFPTPKSLIERMLDHADIEDDHEVLEPSAGIGSIMDAIAERHPNAKVHGIEQNFDIAEVLKLKGHSHDRGDFLEHTKNYDRIVMNPPFEHRQDEKHVKHAYERLKPGGKMVAIMGAGAHTNERSAGFRDWLSTVGAKVYDTPEGAFATDEAFRKTGVNTKMVVISKPFEGGSDKYSALFAPTLLGDDEAWPEPYSLEEWADVEQYAGKCSKALIYNSGAMNLGHKKSREIDTERYEARWDESKHPRNQGGQFSEVGHSFTAAPHRGNEPHVMTITNMDGKHATVSNQWGMTAKVPKQSLEHMKADLTGDLSYLKQHGSSGHEAIDRVINGGGKFIGKGNDSAVWDSGDGNVVKSSTTVPYHAVGGGSHQTPEAATAAARKQFGVYHDLKKAGVKGMPEQTLIEHGGRAFTVQEKLNIVDKYTPEQARQASELINSLHDAGYAFNDDLQFGVDAKGQMKFFDFGTVKKNDASWGVYQDDQATDRSKLGRIYEQAGIADELLDPPHVAANNAVMLLSQLERRRSRGKDLDGREKVMLAKAANSLFKAKADDAHSLVTMMQAGEGLGSTLDLMSELDDGSNHDEHMKSMVKSLRTKFPGVGSKFNYALELYRERYAGKNQFLFDFADNDHEPVAATSAKGSRSIRKVEAAEESGDLKIVGISKDVHQCDRCGRSDLDKTIIVQVGDNTSDRYYFGSDCIAKIMGGEPNKLMQRALIAEQGRMGKRESYNDDWLSIDRYTLYGVYDAYNRKTGAFAKASDTWDESKHPREAAGTSVGGQFRSAGGESSVLGHSSQQSAAQKPVVTPASPVTPVSPAGTTPKGVFQPTLMESEQQAAPKSTKKRELTERPDIQQHHSLHWKNQSLETQIALGDWKRQFRGLGVTAARKTAILGEPVTDENIWKNTDKAQLQKIIDDVNAKNQASIAAGGTRLDDLMNYNDVIPRSISERLEGGSRFFDPEALRGKWFEEEPKQEEPQFNPGQSSNEQADAPNDSRSDENQDEPEYDEWGQSGITEDNTPAPITADDFKKAFKARPPAGVSKAKMKQLEKAIRSQIRDDDEVVKAFVPLVVEAFQQVKAEVDQHNFALRQITGATARNHEERGVTADKKGSKTIQSLAALTRRARAGELQPDEKKHFDEWVHDMENQFPHILGGKGEMGLVDMIATGIKPQVDILDQEVAERAITLAGPDFFGSMDNSQPEFDAPSFEDDWQPSPEYEQTPFSWMGIGAMVEIKQYELKAEKMRYAMLSDAKIDAGNYKKKHLSLHGLKISIETKKGERRRPEWPPMPCDYGDFKGTTGADGDAIDVFVGPNHGSEFVCVIDQCKEDGSFDECKVLLGFDNEADAVACYKKAYTKGWKVGPVTCMTVDQFKAWLKDGNQRKQVHKQVSKYAGRFEPVLISKYTWNEADHPRGQPENKGEFVSKGEQSNLADEAYEKRIVPDGWYVHGRSGREELRQDYAVQMTQRWQVAEQYSGRDKGKTGSMWMIRPKDNANVLDFTDLSVSLEWGKKAIESYENGALWEYGEFADIVANVMSEYGDGAAEKLGEEMNPHDIVNSAQLYDVPAFTGWLLHENGIGFVKTEDGAVCLDTEQCHVLKVSSPKGD